MDNFVRHYLVTSLWSETVNLPCLEEELCNGCMDVNEDHPLCGIKECMPFDEYFSIDDCMDEMIETAIADCDQFRRLLEEAYEGMLGYGHDECIASNFWLTRNGHGAEFWEDDYGDIGVEIAELIESNFSGLVLIATELGKVEYF